MDPSSGLVPVGWTYGMPETILACSFLEAAGVQVFAHPYSIASVNWTETYWLGGVELSVPAAQAALAGSRLADFQLKERPRWSLRVLFIALVVYLCVGLPPPTSGLFRAGSIQRAASVGDEEEKML